MSARNAIGTMDRRLTLRTSTVAADASGQPIATWSDLATVWGSKQEMPGQEPYTASEKSAEREAKFVIRYRDDVTPINRIICESREYDIISVSELGRRKHLEIVARVRTE